MMNENVNEEREKQINLQHRVEIATKLRIDTKLKNKFHTL